jgi:type IV pilus assembly protein PilM
VRQAAEAFCARLALEITRSRLSYSRQPNAVPPERILLTGAGSRLPNLSAVLSDKLGLPVERLRWDAEWATTDNVANHEDQLAVGFGLAVAAWARPDSVMNLLPQSRRETMRWRQSSRRGLLVAGLLGLSLLPPLTYHQARTAALQEQVRTLEQALRPMRQVESRHLDNRLRLETLAGEIAVAERLVAHRDAWVRFLADLQARLDGIEDVWLDRLEPDLAPGMTAEGGARRLIVAGRLLDAANPLAKASGDAYAKAKRLMENLVESPFIREVTGERFDTQLPGILRFEIILLMQPEEPL